MKIKWRGKLSERNSFKVVEIPKDAVEFLKQKHKLEPYIPTIPTLIFIVTCVYSKTHLVEKFKLNLLGVILGILLACIFISVHELLHLICFDSTTSVEIFYCSAGISVGCDTPIPKLRYIFTLLLPVCILGIIPMIIWCFVPLHNNILNSIWFIFCAGNIAAAIGDFYNVVHAIKEMPNKSVVQVSGLKCYYYKITVLCKVRAVLDDLNIFQ